MEKAFYNKCYTYGLWGVVLSFLFSGPAFAGAVSEVDDVLRNVTTSAELLPSLLSACAYLLGLLLGATGVWKLKDHVLNPQQTPLKTPIIRFIIGGALFALPMIYDAMATAINGGTVTNFNPTGTVGGVAATALGFSTVLQDFNTVLASIENSFADMPGFVAAGCYMLGLLIGVVGLLKIKEHVENSEQTPMREGIIRLLIGGALFSIPTIYQMVYESVGGPAGFLSTFFSGATFLFSGYSLSGCNPFGTKLGNVLCATIIHAGAFPAFLTSVGYLIGIVLAVWGIIKIKAHVLNPGQTPVHEGITRLLAAGLFFALPAMVQVVKATMTSTALVAIAFVPNPTRFNETDPGSCNGLDGVVYCFMNDMLGPMHLVLNFFSFCAGAVLIMIGISRLMKTAQEGARGPGGLGTFMTFAAGGALISYNELVRAATATFFTSPVTATRGTLAYTDGMSAAELAHVHTVISAIIKFMILVGLVSFIRGIFIIRDVAEGNSQASLMAGVTHMVGGALAVNLGPLINAVQTTLGITGFGINFI